ncbi:MAG: amidohydrolase family protein [Actinomycetota bacterium]
MAPRLIDVDQHLHEPRAMWREHIDPDLRDLALSIEDDELGYAWLTWQGRRLYPAEIQTPGKASLIGKERLRMEAHERAEAGYDEVLPPEYTDAKARVAALDRFGLDAAVLFPNFGLLWEESLSADRAALCGNMRAFNRWMSDVVTDGDGRLYGVAHVTLRDPEWLATELKSLSAAGIRLAMTAPAPVDGKALSHPDLDPVWRAFCEAGVAPVFHVGAFRQPLDPAWYEGDPEPVDKLLGSAFLWVAPAVALANMAIHGTFERFPDLRIGVIELTAHWVPQFLLMLDGSWGFYAARHGRPLRDLPLRPSEYIRRQVRVGALAYEQPAGLIDLCGEDTFMFGSDWPHAEGIADPLGTYAKVVPDLQGSARDKLFGGNAEWLLGL